MEKEQKEKFKKSYHNAVKRAAKANGKTLKQLSEEMGIKHNNNLTYMLQNGYPNGILKSIEPFEYLDATIEVKINLSNGQKIVLK